MKAMKCCKYSGKADGLTINETIRPITGGVY